MSDQEKFNQAYWASFPPAVRALAEIPGGEEMRQQVALELAQTGLYKIDPAIHYRGLDPYLSMRQWEYYGYKWLPNLLMPPPVWDTNGWSPCMDAALAPPGAIKVSSKIEDYPPYDPPRPPAPPDDKASPSDIWTSPTTRGVRLNDTSPGGTTWKDEKGATWLKYVKVTPFGNSQWWEVVT